MISPSGEIISEEDGSDMPDHEKIDTLLQKLFENSFRLEIEEDFYERETDHQKITAK